MRKVAFVLVVALAVLSTPGRAVKVDPLDLQADQVVVAQIQSVQGYFGPRGIIYSSVAARVEKVLKGQPRAYIDFTVEGGFVGDMALKVSESPEFAAGEKARLYFKAAGTELKLVGHEKLDAKGRPAKAAAGCCKVFAHWSGAAPYRVNANCGDTTGELRDIQDGAAAWNSPLSYAGGCGTTAVGYNGVNEIFFSPTSSGSAIAVTYTWYNRKSGLISEFDMLFYDGGWTFKSIGEACNQGFYVRTIATHELGHAIGIDHNRCTSSIMYPYASYCGTNMLSADDQACAAKLYR